MPCCGLDQVQKIDIDTLRSQRRDYEQCRENPDGDSSVRLTAGAPPTRARPCHLPSSPFGIALVSTSVIAKMPGLDLIRDGQHRKCRQQHDGENPLFGVKDRTSILIEIGPDFRR